MKALITGINGFAGSHLADYLLSQGIEVFGTVRPRSVLDNLVGIEHKISLFEVDIRDPHSCFKVLKDVRPDVVYHLAALSFVPVSWTNTSEVMMVNVMGTLNILQAIREYALDATVIVAGSSEEYGMVYDNEIPIKETAPLRPLSPYGVSKVSADKLALQFFLAYKLKVIVTRAFNHTGPRRPKEFVVSSFCNQVAKIKLGLVNPQISFGNLLAIRDFTDVRDIVRAYYLVSQSGEPGEVYNICSGTGYVIEELLNMIISRASCLRDIAMTTDLERMRLSDVPILIGDCSKVKSKISWEPEIKIEQTIDDMLFYWWEYYYKRGSKVA